MVVELLQLDLATWLVEIVKKCKTIHIYNIIVCWALLWVQILHTRMAYGRHISLHVVAFVPTRNQLVVIKLGLQLK